MRTSAVLKVMYVEHAADQDCDATEHSLFTMENFAAPVVAIGQDLDFDVEVFHQKMIFTIRKVRFHVVQEGVYKQSIEAVLTIPYYAEGPAAMDRANQLTSRLQECGLKLVWSNG
jgi:hypothetical protein